MMTALSTRLFAALAAALPLLPACSGNTMIDVMDEASSGLIISDPLTDGKTVALRVGGTSTTEGWRTNARTDQLRYVLPPGTTEGTVQFEVRGIAINQDGADPRRNI